MKYRPGAPIIMGPIFLDNKKTRVGAVLRDPHDPRGARWVEDKVDADSPFIRDLCDQWTPDNIEANTQREVRISRINREAEDEERRRRKTVDEREVMYQAKSTALEMPEVIEAKSPKAVKLKSKIRKAKTPAQVQAYLSALLLLLIDEEDADTAE